MTVKSFITSEGAEAGCISAPKLHKWMHPEREKASYIRIQAF